MLRITGAALAVILKQARLKNSDINKNPDKRLSIARLLKNRYNAIIPLIAPYCKSPLLMVEFVT
jgi:hypothetical protein